MMTQAFYTAVSGAKSSQTALDVASDNIANISTVGYRGYTTEFSSLFESAIATPSSSIVDSSIGLGTKVQTTSMTEGKGNIILTERSTDLAILGDGWFGVQGEGDVLYTRAGDFLFDTDRNLVTSDGMHVLGTMGNNVNNGILTQQLGSVPLGNITAQQNLSFPESITVPAQATQNVSFVTNLGITLEGEEDLPKVVSASAIDPQGNTNHLELVFTKSEVQTTLGSQWDVEATTKSSDGSIIYDSQKGLVSFDENGAISSTTLTNINNNGATVNMDFGKDFEGVVSIQRDVKSSSTSDGVPSGELNGYDVNQNGEIVATFTNGVQSSVARVAVYHFQNDQGLERAGSSKFTQTSNSGEALFFKDAAGNNILGTSIINNSLENSNVKMEVALTELIVLQRSFDSSSKIISTADQMLQKAIDMGA